MKTSILGLATALLMASAPLAAAGDISLTDGRVPQPAPGMQAAALYGTITNTGAEEVTITAASAEGFAKAMLHTTAMTNGAMRMDHLKSITLAPGATFVMAPMEAHLMLMRPDAPLAVGGTVRGTFRLSDGTEVPFAAEVVHAMPMAGGHKGHGS